MASITETLPIEVIDFIIENLAALVDDGDRGNTGLFLIAVESLRACSLTCRYLRPLCQKQIFKVIEFSLYKTSSNTDTAGSFDPNNTAIARFAQTVETSPTIGSYVKEVTFKLRIGINDDFEAHYPPDTLSSALRSLTRLRAITLWGSYSFGDWDNASPSLKSEISRLFRLPTLTKITLTTIQNFDIYDLTHCVGLETLILMCVSFAETCKDYPIPSPVKPIQPLHLHVVGYEQPVLPKLMSLTLFDGRALFDFEYLKSFAIIFFKNLKEDLIATAKFLQFSLPSLQLIGFSFLESLGGTGVAFLCLNDAMRRVKNLVLCFPSKGVNDCYLTEISALFQKLAGDNQIKVLQFHITYEPGEGPNVGDDPNWDLLNNALLAPGWSFLTEINFQIISLNSSNPDLLTERNSRAERLRKLPETRLKGLSSSQSFKLIWNVTTRARDPRDF